LTGTLFTFFARWLNRLQPSESVVFGGAALAVGLSAGAGVWLFKRLIDLTHFVAFDTLGAWMQSFGGWTVALLPAGGGLLVGWMMHWWVEEQHRGVAGIMHAVALAGGRLPYARMPVKTVAAALSLGSGASVGPEDPSVQIGANLGSLFGQLLRLSDDRVRALVAAGAASGIAAAFNAPIAGVFFALEIILGEIGGALGVIVLAAVAASVLTQALAGPQPAFRVSAYAFNSPWELPLYLGLGVSAGPIAALYIRLLYAARDGFDRLRAPRWLKPALAGLIVGGGVIVLGAPQVFGVGYETIERVLNGEPLALGLLVMLLAAKIALTPVSIGGGFPGGVFAPALFLGAMLGGAYGRVAQTLFPALNLAPPAFAMVGMAAVLAGAVHAPLTAILLLFEMTNDYRIILPLMFAVVIALLISQRLQRDSVYTVALTRQGIRLARGRDVEVLEAITVGEVMQTDAPALRESDALDAASDLFARLRVHGLAVVNDTGELTGIVTVQDLDRAENGDAQSVGEICTRDLLTAFPDETLGAALRRMSGRDIGRLPVVARDNPRHLLGILRRADLIRAYDLALTRRATARHRAQQTQLSAVSRLNVIEIKLEAGAPIADKCLSELALPRECVIASVRRGRQVILPRGDTVLRAGDVLAAVADIDARAILRQLCRTQVDNVTEKHE
jgi:CIC family chloride channel protein